MVIKVIIFQVVFLFNYLNNFYDFEAHNPLSQKSDEDYCEPEVDSQAQDGGVTVNVNGKFVHCLTIIGQIEGHYTNPPNTKSTKYEHIIPRVVAVEEDESISGLLIILNTVGGDIEAGLAIAELVSSMSKKTASLVLGGSHSIGIPLAVCADRSFIVPTASMTVHPVRMNGTVIGVPQTLIYLKKMEQRVIDFVSRNSKIAPQRFKELMLNNEELVSDFGTVLDGHQAVREGLIDEIGGLAEVMRFLSEDEGAE